MRWVFAFVLAGVLAVGLFLGMGRLITDGEDRGYEVVERYDPPLGVQTPLPDWVFEYCQGCLRDGEQRLPFSLRPKMQSLSENNDEVETAILNKLQSYKSVAREGGRYWQSSEPDWYRSLGRPDLPNSMPSCIIHGGPCDRHPTPSVEYPVTTERLPDADCDVSFGLSPLGEPIEIEVNCTHPAFEEVSRKAISELKYPTEDACGPCFRERQRVVIPLRFQHE